MIRVWPKIVGRSDPPQVILLYQHRPQRRRHDIPFGQRDACQDSSDVPTHGEQLDAVDANLEVFGREGAQVLDRRWLDVSRFSLWRRENVVELPRNAQVLADDLHTYAVRGIRCITRFAVWIDDEGPPRMSSISRPKSTIKCVLDEGYGSWYNPDYVLRSDLDDKGTLI